MFCNILKRPHFPEAWNSLFLLGGVADKVEPASVEADTPMVDVEEDSDLSPLFFQPDKAGFYSPRTAHNTPERFGDLSLNSDFWDLD